MGTAVPRHDRDAGGDPGLLAVKADLRAEAWRAIEAAGAARFPGAEGRIPNFLGAEAAAERLRGTPAWQQAAAIKANPDSPQLPVRRRALEDGKVVFMAAPRLASPEPFFVLDPARLPVPARRAASIGGASRHGRPVELDELEPVDLVVAGCVAVDTTGARLGKGGGFSDLEYALGWEAGLIGPRTVMATTVHEAQVLEPGRIPLGRHDFLLNLIVTPDRVIRPRRPAKGAQTPSILWEELTEEKIAAIPLLGRLRSRRSQGD